MSATVEVPGSVSDVVGALAGDGRVVLAGGTAVMPAINTTAHDVSALVSLRRAGLTGIEVDHEDHTADDRAALREIASSFELVVTGSSDHHGTGKTGHPLGVNTTEPAEYERLLERGRQAAAAAGREVPRLGVA
jgi:hypothetical protein